MTRPSSLADLASIYDSQPISGMRNRIINGDMRISQRNGTSSVNISSDAYSLDRWLNRVSGGGVITNQQSTAVVPTGFAYSAALTVQTADSSIAAGDVYDFEQRIEGFNTADLGWGTASAQSIALSFWVRSSVTGTYGVGIQSAAYTRSYVTTYTISAANTWEFKTILIPGDTSGTQNISNGLGVGLCFDLGSGTNCNATAGTWGAGGGLWRTSGSVNWIANAGATFYLTGVQLEAGPFATPFERRSFGQEFALCQRYFQRIGSTFFGATEGTTTFNLQVPYWFPMRASTTVTGVSGGIFSCRYAGDTNITNPTLANITSNAENVWLQVVSSGLSSGVPIYGRSQNHPTSNFLNASAEL